MSQKSISPLGLDVGTSRLVVARQAEEEFPDAQFADFFGGARARVASAVKDANLGERASKLRLPEMRKPSGGGASSAAPETSVSTVAAATTASDVATRKKYGKDLTGAQPLAVLRDAPRR